MRWILNILLLFFFVGTLASVFGYISLETLRNEKGERVSSRVCLDYIKDRACFALSSTSDEWLRKISLPHASTTVEIAK